MAVRPFAAAVAATVISAAALLYPGIAMAESAVGAHVNYDDQFSLGVLGDDGVNRIMIQLDDSEPDPLLWTYEITDPAGIRAAFGFCEIGPPTMAICKYKGHASISVRRSNDVVILDGPFRSSVRLGSGNDRLEGAERLSFPGNGDKVFGGWGSDAIYGRGGPDRLYGDWRADDLLGGQGRDYLVGGPGPDWIVGARGDDRLIAADGQADGSIDCGAGEHDSAVVDERDPDPLACERVVVVD